MPRLAALLLLAASAASALSAPATTTAGPSYDQLRGAAVQRCQAIDPAEYQSGLLFNPDGHRSYYVQSECYQRTAEQFRDPSLCALVRERRSLFMSSWAYSAANCQALVARGVAADRRELEDLRREHARGAVRLRDFRVERNGNGRDIDIIPEFSGSLAHTYLLEFELLGTNGGVVIFRSSFHLDGTNNVRLFVRYSDLLTQVPQLERDRTYGMRARLTLDLGHGRPSGQWSGAFLERTFPARERSQVIDRDVRF